MCTNISAVIYYSIIFTVIGFNPSNYTVKESDRILIITAMILEGYILDGENVTVAVSTRGGTATGMVYMQCTCQQHSKEGGFTYI